MTIRTVSLLLLFVGALGMTGLLMAMMVSFFSGSRASGPWLAPALAVACQTAVLFLGRRYVLSGQRADSDGRIVLTLAFVVTLSLVGALAAVWLLQWVLGSSVQGAGVTLPLWFALLWLAVLRQEVWLSWFKKDVQ